MSSRSGQEAGLWFERQGEGPDLVLLHGWSMHSGVWSFFKDALAQHFCVTLIDLPGHGRNLNFEPTAIDEFSDRLLEIIPQGAFGMGWSLGGMLLLNTLARDPSRFGGGILMASTPKFSAGAGWSGVSHAALAGMGESLEQDPWEALRRFVSLQTLGQAGARDLSKILIEQLQSQPIPSSTALAWGLSILAHADFRAKVRALALPLLVILGARDRLIPSQIASELEKLNPRLQLLLLEDAGHVPFLTHPEDVCQAIVRFVDDQLG